nr:low density lipoprotein receptor adapter protein 1-like isoform X2 [Anolis sagrei ordinatus]
MEALRAAGRAVLRSPSLARHRLGVARLRRPRPQRLLAAEGRDPLPSPVLLEGGVGFALKYLGMTLVGEPKGEQMAAAAVRRILAMTRVGPKKFRKVLLTVSPRGLSLQDAETQEAIESISIYRISYCTTDKLQNKVFAYVAQNPRSGALECHAFLSPKKKVAQAVTLTVAQAFQVALDLWEAAQAGSRGDEEEEEEEGVALQGENSLVLCSSEGACCRPSGSPPFKANFEEEEEDDDEDDEEEGDLNDNLSSCLEEGVCPAAGKEGPQTHSPLLGLAWWREGPRGAPLLFLPLLPRLLCLSGGGHLAFSGGSPSNRFLPSLGAWSCSPPSSCLPPGTLF